ncbi:MAG: hypothetical protein C4584_01510 [Armatimonadetes bacterium]|nr:MAG: hypothetical protein C4584_01510 [Armatimonadota bacterium]
MHPVLFSIGSTSVSSFGLFLALAFLVSVFIIWRLAKIYDISEEKVIDLSIVTFFGAVVGARIYFILTHLDYFNQLDKILLINRYPGLSFWGGLIGGLFVFTFMVRQFKLNFWQMSDFAVVGLSLGFVLGNIGCFLGGCSPGITSDSWLAAPVVGIIGKRFPVSFIEGIAFIFVFIFLWRQVIRFHFNGKVLALFLLFLGVSKWVTEGYRAEVLVLNPFKVTHGEILALILFLSGFAVFYNCSKRRLLKDLNGLVLLLTSDKRRHNLLILLRKNWYNHITCWRIGIRRLVYKIWSVPKVLSRRLHVKSNPTDFR